MASYPTAHHHLPSLQDQELVLTPIEIERLCAHALKGEFEPVDQWIQLCRGTFGMDHVEEGSLFPDNQSSPFVVAAHACQDKFLRHMLKRYPDAIPINRTAKISLPFILGKGGRTLVHSTRDEYQTPQEAKTEHYCSAVLAACAASSGRPRRLDVVKLLVRAGGSVNTPECCGITPLHAALMYGYNPKLVEFLLNQGADTNATDCLSRTPLMLAITPLMRANVARGHACSIATRLIKGGAKVCAVDKTGQSVLHYAASVGSSEIVRLLLASGADPMFKPARAPINDQTESYVPCPLYLAAAKGHGKLVEELLDHPGCPPVCKAEALLLMGARECELSRRWFSVYVEGLWGRALSVLEDHNINLDYPVPITDYGNRKELRSVSELHSMSSAPFTLHEAHYQSLIIRERCMGYADPTLVHSLFHRGYVFLSQKKFLDSERVLLRAAEMMLHNACRFGYGKMAMFFSQGETPLLNYYVGYFAQWVQLMSQHKHSPDFPRYLRITLRIVELHGSAYGFNTHDISLYVGKSTGISNFFKRIALLLESWLLHNECVDENGFHIGSDECEEIGQKLVKLFSRHGSVIGFLLCELCWPVKDAPKIPVLNHLPVFAAFLRWGAARQINEPLRCCGQRQLHMAVLHARDYDHHKPMVSLLLQFGAHYDAVNAAGQTARELCASAEEEEVLFPPPFPLPLTCYASRSIVKHYLPYKDMDLPSRMKQLIMLHDTSAFT